MITTTLRSSYRRKTLVPFCLRKKRAENAFFTNSELSQNHTGKGIISFKTTVNWLFTAI